jgi:hypothetical protein
MSFSVNMSTAAIRNINSHADAVDFYKSCLVTGEYGEERRIKGKANSKQMGVSIDLKGDVVFRYHHTEVVIWHRNNSYTINSYSSRSTDAFASAFMPSNASLSKQGSQIILGHYRDEDCTAHPIYNSATVRGKVVKTDAVFTKDVINRKAAKKVLATTRYTEYREWYGAMWPMVRDDLPPTYRREYLSWVIMQELMSDSDQWHRMMVSQQGCPDYIRNSIYDCNWITVHDTKTAKMLPVYNSSGWQVTRK